MYKLRKWDLFRRWSCKLYELCRRYLLCCGLKLLLQLLGWHVL